MNFLLSVVFISTSLFSSIAPAPAPTIGCEPHTVENYTMPGWVTNETWYRPMPQHTIGRALPYAPGIMNSTAEYREMDLEGFAGGVATNSVAMMGEVVWLKRPSYAFKGPYDWEGPFLVVDVGQRNHAYHQAINVKSIVEVDFETAIRWGIYAYSKGGKGYVINRWFEDEVQMWVGLTPPNHAGGSDIGQPVNYRDWYLKNAEICDGEMNRRWKLEDWMIKDYSDYATRLISEDGEDALQESGTELDEQGIRNAISANNYLASLVLPPAIANKATSSTPEGEILTVHTLLSNETWTHLAAKYYGNMSEPYWRLIYEANIDLVGDKYYRIWGGMELVIPALPIDFP